MNLCTVVNYDNECKYRMDNHCTLAVNTHVYPNDAACFEPEELIDIYEYR